MSAIQQQSRAKLVIQMSGAPGSGKSTIARLLRAYLGGAIIDHDVLRSCLLTSGNLSFDAAAKQAYLLQWDIARDLMKQGLDSVIVDSTCNYPEVVKHGTALAAECGYVYWYVECRTNDIDLLDQRLRARPAMASQRTAVNCPPAASQGNGARQGEDARALFARWIESPCRPPEGEHVIVVDASDSPENLCAHILEQTGRLV